MIQLKDLFNNLTEELGSLYDNNEATSIARIVFREKLGLSRTDIALDGAKEVGAPESQKIARAAKRLLEGVPVQQVLGFAHFYDMRLKVNKHTLIPRPETEELVQWIINDNKNKTSLEVLDIGTGSGCIAIALAKGLSQPQVQAIDISKEALNAARYNARINDSEIKFTRLDILASDKWKRLDKYDIIVSNPPYIRESEKVDMHINVLNHDPHNALFVKDEEPLLFYDRISDMALMRLTSGGKLYFEINEAYGLEMHQLLEYKGFKDVQILKDIFDKNRFAMGIYYS